MEGENELAETDFERNIRNVEATLQIEGMQLGASIRERLARIESGSATYQQIVEELKTKHSQNEIRSYYYERISSYQTG